MQTATNKETGERVALVEGAWMPIEQSASNDKGEKAYLIAGKWITDSAAPGPQAEPNTASRLSAGAGGVNRGVAGLLGLPMDTVENVYNLGKAGVGTLATAAGRPDLAPELTKGTPLGSEWLSRQMNKVGIGTGNPNPDDTASQMLHTGGMITGASIVPGAGVRSTAAAAVGGAVAEQIDPRLTGLGAVAPAAALQAGRGIKQSFAGNAAGNLGTFKQAGVTPSAGQATESGFFRGIENLASKFPGGTSVMRKFSEHQQSKLGEFTKQTAVDAETAGRAIEKGVRGEGGFLERTKATWLGLDNALAAKVGNPSITPTETMQTLQKLTTPTHGAEATTGAMVNPKLAQIRQGIETDWVNNVGLPYQSLRELRTRVGSWLDDALVSGVPQGELKQVYGALSRDLQGAAKAVGAEKEFARQNQYYSARMDRIESVLDKVIGKDRLPEDIFKAVNPTNPDQANRIRSVMRSLNTGERQTVSEAIVNRMGRSTPGRQNEAGDVWSSETFLTNWNKLSPGAKAQILPDTKLKQDMEAVASIASNIREGSKVFSNPSGTAGAVAPYGLTVMAATGNVLPAGGIVLGTNIGAKLLVNPKFVEWLASAAKSNEANMPLHLIRLSVIYNNEKDPQTKQEMERYVNSIQ